MATLEHAVVGRREGHANGKALVSLILGVFAMANVTATVLMLSFRLDEFELTTFWLLPSFLAFLSGITAAFLGSLGWIDVRRGITNRRLFEAQFGTFLGGIATALVLAAFGALVLFLLSFALTMGGMD